MQAPRKHSYPTRPKQSTTYLRTKPELKAPLKNPLSIPPPPPPPTTPIHPNPPTEPTARAC
ncbi:uncharacterized protein K452DRAFT_285638 [Aplosporella prunicola CBS 121167]|uniref:Uncharacterized protein n=1 Tax=Aplosporella prunicola CBS 121167 TaxID=1176127 RepID=A0A6A6BHI6_9PEZI|nr:uncharacterized protein K452DRAFT_285638 [Aplosporella prunicola CBS 121167]KAF2143600.1 hypothetical protein K452DRAFT_285638 [Aplosporella prunicola CBS 121167]